MNYRRGIHRESRYKTWTFDDRSLERKSMTAPVGNSNSPDEAFGWPVKVFGKIFRQQSVYIFLKKNLYFLTRVQICVLTDFRVPVVSPLCSKPVEIFIANRLN